MTPFEQYVRLVDSPENQALPEAERLPMVGDWNKHIDEGWFRFRWYDGGKVYPAVPEPIDPQAASGLLTEWLAIRSVAVCKTGDSWEIVYGFGWWGEEAKPEKYPTMLAAQVAAAWVVLGVK